MRLELKTFPKRNPYCSVFNWCPSSSNQGTLHIFCVKILPSCHESSHNSYRYARTKTLMSGIWTFSLNPSFRAQNLHHEFPLLKTNLTFHLGNHKQFNVCHALIQTLLYTPQNVPIHKSTLAEKFNDTFGFPYKNIVISCTIFNKYSIHNKLHLEHLYQWVHKKKCRQTWMTNIVHPKSPLTFGIINKLTHNMSMKNILVAHSDYSCSLYKSTQNR